MDGHFGSRRFATPDESRNVNWLALPWFGEAWHDNHHAFPRSYRHGLRWYEIDVSALLIGGLERLGLVWDVIRIDEERMQREAEVMAETGGGRHAPSAPPRPLAERKEVAVGLTDVE